MQHMTYNVFGGTLNLAQSINQDIRILKQKCNVAMIARMLWPSLIKLGPRTPEKALSF